MEDKKILLSRKERIEYRLKKYGILNSVIDHLPYLRFDSSTFQTPQKVAKRTIILYGLSYATNSFFSKLKVKKWFVKEHLWNDLSKEEQSFLSSFLSNRDLKIRYSWAFEGAVVLNWALNKTDDLTQIIEEISQSGINDFLECIPSVGSSTKDYIEMAKYRSLEAIFEENLVNELATSYFRDIMIFGTPDVTNINRDVSFERHKALNWVRKFGGIEDWDEVDTST